jgi:hypothetical protein
MSASPLAGLSDLAGLRSAPTVDGPARQRLREQLEARTALCSWFTIGVMAPSGPAALEALRACERALGWTPLEPDPAGSTPGSLTGPVFLKGNQRIGRFLLRSETGLGEGILITGHNPDDPDQEDTWGPLPLDLFAA